jgi:hypothetical protein
MPETGAESVNRHIWDVRVRRVAIDVIAER